MFKSYLIPALVWLTWLPAFGADGYLGLSIRPLESGGASGLRIAHIYDDAAAGTAGLRENDIITGVNGQPVGNLPEFRDMLSPFSWGDAVLIAYLRDGKPGSLSVRLGHAATTKTHNIIKSEQLTGETIWYFDDNTTVVMKAGRPVSVTNKVDGRKQTLELDGLQGFQDLPQRFMDLPHKLDVIAYTLEEQRLRGEDADRITFIEEALHEVPAKRTGIATAATAVFDVYPNPSTGRFNVRVESARSGELTWDVFDLRGASVASGGQTGFQGGFEQDIDLSAAQKGMYLLYIRIGEEKLTRQLVLE